MGDAAILGGAADRWARGAILGLTLVTSCIIGLLTPYALGVIGIALLLALALRGRLIAAWREPAALPFLAAFLVLGLCYAISAEAPVDVLLVFNFTMLVLFAPLSLLLRQGAAPSNGERVAQLALAGAALALIAAAAARFGTGNARAESAVFGAILLGNTAILLGYLSLAGIIAGRGARRWIYLLGPLLGIATTFLSGSRGPLLAVLPLTLVAAVFIAGRFRIKGRWVVAALLLMAGLLAGGFVLFQDRFAPLLTMLGDIASGMPVRDDSTRIRLALYDAGFRAFLDAPVFGHGWARLMSAVMPYLSGLPLRYAGVLPQLHNDILDFAVAAGVVGIGVYVALLAPPMVAARRMPRDSQFAVRLFGCAILCTAYVFDGLTDLMLGFEFHTALYVALAAILLGYCRDATGPAAG